MSKNREILEKKIEALQQDAALYKKKFEEMFKLYNKFVKTVRQPELFDDDKVFYPPDVPKNIEGWSISKRKDQKGWFGQRMVQGFRMNIHIPETEDGGICIGAVRNSAAKKLNTVQEQIEQKADERMKKRREYARQKYAEKKD